jgi:hypothetical protein
MEGGSVRRIAAVVLVGGLLAGCAESAAPAAPTPAAPTEFIVLAKTTYVNGPGNTNGKAGYYVTVVIAGKERETSVSYTCYEKARVGIELSRDCR